MGYARIPNGTGAFIIQPPTFNLDNETPLDVDDESVLPKEFTLYQNNPNPFNPTTTISFQLPITSQVTLKVYDILGNEVAILVNENKPVGSYEVMFDASRLSSGMYFYRLDTKNFSQVRKMILLK
ncbi:MAG: T9SS type A sorting domain-containing protein [Ignavibacteriales bacterium]|nr:T9SS type A sorting domain-containing protein [Ignavibacteriales bacterium]